MRERLLWISGNPGMGKSVLASFLLNHLEDSVKKAADRTKRVIYFFFNDQDENKKTIISFLRAVIHQLLAASPSLLRKHVTPHYESLGDQLYGSFATLWKIFIGITNDPELGGGYCVIDALDECEDKSRVQLLQQLTELSNASPATSGTSQQNFLKFILTSRPYDYIRVELSGSSVIHLGAEHEDESVNADISKFIASEVKNLARNRGYNHSLRETVEYELNKGADGMFLWVVLIIEILKKTPTSDIERKMKELPKKIDDVYTQILRDMPTFGWKILMWVLYAHRPLKLDELAVAYTIRGEHKILSSISADVLDGIRGDIKLCGPILKVQKDNSVHLVHQSAKDFLLRPDLADPSTRELLASNSQSHYEIAIACVTYLSLDNFLDPQINNNLKNPYNREKYLEFLSSPESGPFLKYAVLFWHQHVVQAEEKSVELWECVYGLLRVEPKRNFSMNAYHYFDQKNRYHTFIHRLSTLHILCRFGLHFFLQNLSLQEKVDVNSRDSDDRTPLAWATSEGHVEIVKLLLGAQGVDANSKDKYGRTPLSWAASEGHVEVVKLLLGAQGVDVNSKGPGGDTPLYWAAFEGHVEIVKLLLGAQGVDVNPKGPGGDTPLHWAVSEGHVEVVKLLLGAQGVDVNSKNQCGETPLHWAASDGHVEVVKLLLGAQGVDVNSKNQYGKTLLYWAASEGHEEVDSEDISSFMAPNYIKDLRSEYSPLHSRD